MNAFELHEPNWNMIEPACLTSAPQILNNQLILHTQFGDINLTISQFGLRMSSGKTEDALFGMLTTSPTNLNLSLTQQGDIYHLSGGDYRLEFHSSPFHFKFFKQDILVQQSATDGHFVRQHRLPPLAKT